MMYMFIVEVIYSLLELRRIYRQLCFLVISSVFLSLGLRGNVVILWLIGVNCCKRMLFKDYQLRIYKFLILKEIQLCKVIE